MDILNLLSIGSNVDGSNAHVPASNTTLRIATPQGESEYIPSLLVKFAFFVLILSGK